MFPRRLSRRLSQGLSRRLSQKTLNRRCLDFTRSASEDSLEFKTLKSFGQFSGLSAMQTLHVSRLYWYYQFGTSASLGLKQSLHPQANPLEPNDGWHFSSLSSPTVTIDVGNTVCITHSVQNLNFRLLQLYTVCNTSS